VASKTLLRTTNQGVGSSNLSGRATNQNRQKTAKRAAIAEMKTALTLDPLSPMSNTILGFTYCFARAYEHALEQYKDVASLSRFLHCPRTAIVALHHAGTLSRSHFRTRAGANADRQWVCQTDYRRRSGAQTGRRSTRIPGVLAGYSEQGEYGRGFHFALLRSPRVCAPRRLPMDPNPCCAIGLRSGDQIAANPATDRF